MKLGRTGEEEGDVSPAMMAVALAASACAAL